VEGAGRVSKSAAAATTFWLALANVGRGVPSWLMAVAMALTKARALVKSMVAARSISSMALHRRQACHDVEPPVTRRRSAKRGPVLCAPPGRLVF
jgi:hypothetical protein